jgi:effector-binding domain-containing protein
MIDPPQIAQSAAQQTAFIRFTVPRNEIQQVMGPGYQELMETITAQGISPNGPWFNHHLRMDAEVFDFELGVPVASPVRPTGRVQAGELPAATVARTVYHGGYEGLGAAWGEFEAWIAAQNLSTGPDLWECYVAGPESSPDPAMWRTELNRPLA